MPACLLDDPYATTDGGVTLSSDGGMGTGVLTGPLAFAPNSVSELHNLDTTGNVNGFSFVLTTDGLSCSQLQALNGGPIPGDYQVVYGGVLGQTGGGEPAVGTYQIGTAGLFSGFLQMGEHYPDGGASQAISASSGSITFTTASEGEIAGNFSAVVTDANGQQSTLQGTFDAPYCP